jgi:hypothetical protein
MFVILYAGITYGRGKGCHEVSTGGDACVLMVTVVLWPLFLKVDFGIVAMQFGIICWMGHGRACNPFEPVAADLWYSKNERFWIEGAATSNRVASLRLNPMPVGWIIKKNQYCGYP